MFAMASRVEEQTARALWGAIICVVVLNEDIVLTQYGLIPLGVRQ